MNRGDKSTSRRQVSYVLGPKMLASDLQQVLGLKASPEDVKRRLKETGNLEGPGRTLKFLKILSTLYVSNEKVECPTSSQGVARVQSTERQKGMRKA